MTRYLLKKIATYLVAFFVATTVDWGVPHLMPGNPVQLYISRFPISSIKQYEALQKTFTKSFGLGVPLWRQYLNFWDGVLHWRFGVSFYATAPVTHVIAQAIPYTLALLVPAVVLSYVFGNRIGAMAARRKWLDNVVLPVGYVFQAAPFAWLALLLAYYFSVRLRWFPPSGGSDPGIGTGWNWSFFTSALDHWFLPFLSVFLVSFGGWAIGMRNLVIYELETDYARYLRSMGASQRLVRRYAYRNAVLPQLSGLALALGTIIGGNIVTEVVFQYPGLGHLIFEAITDEDYFLLQGIFLLLVIAV
ncbi:MAG TPA: ABC transporter permease, partial [Acidimicrobiales bacterium]|nr:ABC transporter permease [Acidimicrobiales bacterium]